MSTDWRALCEELADALDHNRQCLLDDRREAHPLADKARAALARWGRPAPAPAEGEVAELVAKLRRLAPHNPLGTADPTITRAADLLEQRHPAPPAAGEVGELVAAVQAAYSAYGWVEKQQFVRLFDEVARLASVVEEGCDCSIEGPMNWKAEIELLRQRHPAPPAGELLKEAAWLRNECSAENADGNWISMSIDQALDLASLLERQAAPVPAEGLIQAYQAGRRDAEADAQQGAEAAEDGPAGDVAELVRQLGSMAADAEAADFVSDAALLNRAIKYLERQAAPVPVYERDLNSILSPSGGYELREGAALTEGAQLIDGEWWAPVFGCDSVESALNRIRQRLDPFQQNGKLKNYQSFAPSPVPVSERLPGAEDCDAEHYCWRWNTIGGLWARQPLARSWYEFESHWLPATALPLPSGEVQP